MLNQAPIAVLPDDEVLANEALLEKLREDMRQLDAKIRARKIKTREAVAAERYSIRANHQVSETVYDKIWQEFKDAHVARKAVAKKKVKDSSKKLENMKVQLAAAHQETKVAVREVHTQAKAYINERREQIAQDLVHIEENIAGIKIASNAESAEIVDRILSKSPTFTPQQNAAQAQARQLPPDEGKSSPDERQAAARLNTPKLKFGTPG